MGGMQDPSMTGGGQMGDPSMGGGMQDPSMTGDGQMGDPSMGGGMQDPSMMGGMGEEQDKTPKQIGRTYELKKIYSRLLSIQSYLSFTSDVVLQKLRKYVTEAIELFEVLVSNIDSFLHHDDIIDEIIVIYYDFLGEVYNILHKYYEKKKSEKDTGR